MEVKCPKCKKRYEVEGVSPGQEIQTVCPRCSNNFNYVVPIQAVAAVTPVVPATPTEPAVPAVTSVVAPNPPQAEVIRTHPCPQCGYYVNDGASYCPECGTYQFSGPDPNAQPQQVVQPQIVYVQQPQPQPQFQPQPQPMNYGYAPTRIHDRSKMVAALLAFFLGGIGIHKFYLGQTGMGFLYLIFCWTWIPAIIAFVEFIMYLVMSDQEFDAKYNYR